MLVKKAEFTDKQPSYKYALLNDHADVIIYEFIEEKTIDNTTLLQEQESNTESNSQKVYVYNVNIFSCDPKLITEDMVKANPMKYLDYEDTESMLTTEELQNDINIDYDYRLSMIELGLI